MKYLLPTAADSLSVIGFFVTLGLAAFFPELAERYLTIVASAITICFSILLWAVYHRYRHSVALKNSDDLQPQVLLIGGEASRQVMDEITKHHLVQNTPSYIEFVEAPPSTDIRSQVAKADAIIFMPDFSRSSCKAAYESVMSMSQSSPVPIGRYYPQNYAGPRQSDVHTIPFDTPQGIVEYASEFLLKRAVDRGRYVHSRLRLLRAFTLTITAIAVCLLPWGWRAHLEVSQWKAQAQLAPSNLLELAVALADYREAGSAASSPQARTAAMHRLAERVAHVEIEEISRVSRSPAAKRLIFYVHSKDKQQLVPIASSGAPGYPLHAINSIAGCSSEHRKIVVWTGNGDSTGGIRAFEFDGTPVGRYDSQRGVLVLGGGVECHYDNRGIADPKNELLCVPFGIDASRSSDEVPGVACLSTDGEGSPIGQAWLVPHLMRTAMILAALPGIDSELRTSHTKSSTTSRVALAEGKATDPAGPGESKAGKAGGL